MELFPAANGPVDSSNAHRRMRLLRRDHRRALRFHRREGKSWGTQMGTNTRAAEKPVVAFLHVIQLARLKREPKAGARCRRISRAGRGAPVQVLDVAARIQADVISSLVQLIRSPFAGLIRGGDAGIDYDELSGWNDRCAVNGSRQNLFEDRAVCGREGGMSRRGRAGQRRARKRHRERAKQPTCLPVADHRRVLRPKAGAPVRPARADVGEILEAAPRGRMLIRNCNDGSPGRSAAAEVERRGARTAKPSPRTERFKTNEATIARLAAGHRGLRPVVTDNGTRVINSPVSHPG